MNAHTTSTPVIPTESILAFHMMANSLPFLLAAHQLGALDTSQEWGDRHAKR